MSDEKFIILYETDDGHLVSSRQRTFHMQESQKAMDCLWRVAKMTNPEFWKTVWIATATFVVVFGFLSLF